MHFKAQPGTWRIGYALLWLSACSALHEAADSPAETSGLGAQVGDAAVARGEAGRDAAAVSARADAQGPAPSQCTSSGECTLVSAYCCACDFTLDGVRAVLRGPAESEQGATCGSVMCGGCALNPHEPLAAWPAPECVAGQCVVRDLRKADETRCVQDQDCELSAERASCCGSCSADPRAYRAKRKGVRVALAGNTCTGDVLCPACIAAYLPTAYCAADHHCAVRATPAVRGQPTESCYAPGHRASSAYDVGAVGCDCFAGDEAVCEGAAALVCKNGSWQGVEDGPCGRNL